MLTQTSGTPQSLTTEEITLPPSSNPSPTRSSTETHTHAYHQTNTNNQPQQTSPQYHPTHSTKQKGKPRQHSIQPSTHPHNNQHLQQTPKTFTNYKKANWTSFKE